ncbi:hypothetical protein OU995_02890 [Roseateles sp. SL47]|uniref:hypothetical protein n=1 Tax=Roseateles sp. SL47 TaxID=2995138 RepID=UPI00227079D1|nr:hypothetical protein [Roseateles sp. SL47]WAC73706.1 hypothetical protein OU995_02890 [Roseateles sp. SL47]
MMKALLTVLVMGLCSPLAGWAQRPSPSPSTAGAAASAVPGAAASAAPSVRDQEIASCRPGEWSTWGDGRDRSAVSRPLRFVYRHEAAPEWMTAAQVLALAQRAVQAWLACGVPATVQALPKGRAPADEDIQIVWTDLGSQGQFGVANVKARTLSLGPSPFRLLRQRNPRYPSDQTLQMVLSHEMGHFYGMAAHSRRCVDVMSYYDDGKGHRCTLRDPSTWGSVIEYRSMLPTACDIERCRALNGTSASVGSESRILSP